MGITNVVAEKERRNATRVGYQGYPPVVESQYYRIYLLGDYGFIVMKEPARLRRCTGEGGRQNASISTTMQSLAW